MSETPIKLRKTVVPVSFGVEIEGRSTLLSEILDGYHVTSKTRFNGHLGFFYVTTDGSLDYSNSIELVSQPLPPKMLCRVLESFNKKYGEITYEGNAGVHIHITRTPKTESRLLELAQCIWRNRNYSWRFFFGRELNYYCQPKDVYTAECNILQDRYSAVNFQNRDTIEIRAFGNNSMRKPNGINNTISYIKRTQALLDSKEAITYQLLERIANKFPL